MIDEKAASTDPASSVPQSPRREIWLRFVSGLVMAVVTGTLLYLGGAPFALLVTGAAVVAAFEWSRIVRGAGADAGLVAQVLSTLAAGVLTAGGFAALGIAVVVGGTILTALLCYHNRPFLSAEGVLYTGLPVVALVFLRDDHPHGLAAVLFILIAVVATDVAAFVFGRLIGGPKLAPAISPNKTWSGFLGGVCTAGLAVAAFALQIGANPVTLGLAGVILGVLAQIGDLTESALKRSFGVKDSGSIIPGHGGVMDRIDGLVFASAAAGFVAVILNPEAPARALLFGG